MTCDVACGRIVVGVDGTVASAAAVRWAVAEARLRRAAVHLVHARDHYPNGRAPYASPPGAAADEDSTAATRLLAAAVRDARRGLLPGRFSFEVTDGPPARVLIDRSAGADLLVLGAARPAAGSPAEGPRAMGPVARACLRSAHCPVVTVPVVTVTAPAQACLPGRDVVPPQRVPAGT